MDKASSLFQHQAQKAALPYSTRFLRARVRVLHTLHYNPMFFAFTAFTTHRKTPHNDLIRLYDLCFSPLYLHSFPSPCLHPYPPDFQPLSPIGEGVKAIYKHYIVYTRVRAREAKGKNREEAGARKKGTAPQFVFLFLGFGSGSARQVARTSAAR